MKTVKIIFFLTINVAIFSQNLIDFEIISKSNFEEELINRVEPYLDEKREKGHFIGQNNVEIYYENYRVEDSKGAIVIVHGFTEYIDKYYELIYYFSNIGYNVYMMEHRGHGRSGRLGRDNDQVHIENFNYYIEDLKSFIDDIVKPYEDRLYLYAHSMGGGIGAVFLQRYPQYFEKAILNAPMMTVNTGAPNSVVKFYTSIARFFGAGLRYAPGEKPFEAEYNFDENNAGSEDFYRHYHQRMLENKYFQNGGASIIWVDEMLKLTRELRRIENIQRVNIPVIIYQAETDTYVKQQGQERFAKYNENVELRLVPQSRHSIYREVDEVFIPYIKEVLDFYIN